MSNNNSISSHISSRNQKVKVCLVNAGVEDIKRVGVRAEIAEELSQRNSEGKLKSLHDVVSLLQKRGTRCQVNFDDDFQIEIDSAGALSLQTVQCHQQQPPKKKKKRSDPDWAPENGAEEEEAGSPNGEAKSDDDDIDEYEDRERLDVNTASEEELEAITGIGPWLARKIVKYREQNGLFYQIEDLAAVKGISKHSLKRMSPEITVGNVEDTNTRVMKLNPVAPNATLLYEKRAVVRVISWNLQCFSDDKAANEGVVEVICRTILENGVSLAVFQEIGDETAIYKIKEELNHPTIKGLKKLKKHRGTWECVTSDVAGPMFRSREYNGFLFDTSRGIELKSHDLIEKPSKGKKQFARRPFLGFFKAARFDFVLVSVHLKATGLSNEDISRLQKELAHIPDVISAVKDKIPGEKDMLIVGDFNLEPDEDEFNSFREAGLSNLIPSKLHTNISTSNMDGSKCYDNIWISSHTKSYYSTGRAGVIREGDVASFDS
ncbi:hypothetical protein QZH41_010429 [Actinostola sp. cb2023]|nr:hypothetical protein QZH41_010429 [Actinostola sp. cb2023]